MFIKSVLVIFSIILAAHVPCPDNAHAVEEEFINLGKFRIKELDKLIRDANKISKPGERVEFISRIFLGVKYKDSTLKGSNNSPEILTINLEGMDCFTFLDYVEAMRNSEDFSEFKTNLVKTRYENANVKYSKRNHFFTDWAIYNNGIADVTEIVGGSANRVQSKKLNKKSENSRYLEGIHITERDINYIPSDQISEDILNKIRTGDYIGIYSEKTGLDVSHTGIAVGKSDGLYLRHASSREETGKVVDEPLEDYLKEKPGIVVFRPFDPVSP